MNDIFYRQMMLMGNRGNSMLTARGAYNQSGIMAAAADMESRPTMENL